MSYNKRTWATGNIINTIDLNRIKNGIEDSRGVLVANAVYDSENKIYTLDKTWQEIWDAFPFVIEYTNDDEIEAKAFFIAIANQGGLYTVGGIRIYSASSASGYPTYESSGGIE